MSTQEQEIEIKIPLSEKTFREIKGRLKKSGSFERKLRQVDEYFTPPHRNFMEPEFPFEWLRIRTENENCFLTYKHYYPENKPENTHCDEFKLEVEDSRQLKKVFSALNFSPLVTVDKLREIYSYHNDFEIVLDKVQELGYFIEIEAKKDLGGITKTRNRILSLASKLGLDPSDRDKRGYPYLAMKNQKLI